ncbi:hypothetical protein JCM10212_000837 [Sporobolomyces blumeae]
MQDPELPFMQPIASTSRAVLTLAYKPPAEADPQRTPVADLNRVRLYERAWGACHAKIQSTLSSLHDASLDQITQFVRSEATNDDPLSLFSALSDTTLLKTGLILGASPGSSSLIFSALTRQLTDPSAPQTSAQPRAASEAQDCSPSPAAPLLDRPSPVLVSRLTSRDCSNIKNSLRSLISGFIGSDAELEVDEDDEDQEAVYAAQKSSTSKSTLMVPEDLLNLVGWYEHRFGKKDQERSPKLVVLIEDLEAVDGKILNQLIIALSKYTESLPLVLLLGIATTSSALYNLVPQRVTNRMDVSSFYVDPGIGAFNALIRGVFLDWEPPLSLTPKSYTDLYRHFEDLHHSIDSTISYLQIIYSNHFLTSPYAELTRVSLEAVDSRNEGGEHARLEKLVREAWVDLASLATPPQATRMSSHDAETPPPPPPPCPPRTLEAIRRIQDSVSHSYLAHRGPAFEAVLGMLEFWDKKRTVEHCLELVLGSDGPGAERSEGGRGGIGKVIDEVCGLVRQASATKLSQFIRTLVDRLEQYGHDRPNLSSNLSKYLSSQHNALGHVISTHKRNVESGSSGVRSNLVNLNLTMPGFSNGLSGSATSFNRRGATSGREALSDVGGEDLDREFSRIARELSVELKSRLKFALRPCTDVVGWELFFADDVSPSKRLNPAPLPTLLKTLTRLDPDSRPDRRRARADQGGTHEVDERGDIPNPLDLAVAYRTYKSLNAQGRLINLGEWWSEFDLGAVNESDGEAQAEAGGPSDAEASKHVENGNGNGKGKRKAKSGKASKKRARRATSEDDDAENEDPDSDSDDDEGEDDDDEGPERRKHARFLRCVADLAHLGFIHPTTRKPEHVLKSVY